jgi:hypothetical protein
VKVCLHFAVTAFYILENHRGNCAGFAAIQLFQHEAVRCLPEPWKKYLKVDKYAGTLPLCRGCGFND